MGGNYVRVEPQVFIVGIFIASVSLVAHSFDCQVRVINFVYKVENAKRGESNKDKNNCGQNSSDNFNFLGV